MFHSIQDFLKIINSRLTGLDIVSILVTVVFLSCFAIYLHEKREGLNIPVSYISKTSGEVMGYSTDSRPFASVNGKTYTFSWCGGSSNISAKNKVYFESEVAAQNSGRTLSKLCQK